MDTKFLLKGILLGFSIAAPVGPIGVLCIRRTLTDGWASGLVSGLGAATADAFYGSVAGFGLTFISSLLIGQQTWISLIGGLFLCYLGIRTLLSKPAETAASASGQGLLGSYVSTLFLTLTNPMTILSFAAIFTGVGITNSAGDYTSSALLVGGVFIGSTLWWLTLAGGASLFRDKFNTNALRWINRISGVVLTIFGLLSLLSLL